MDYEHNDYTTEVTDKFFERTDELSVPVAAYIVIGALAASENAVALLIVISSKRFRKKRNIFLFSLSLADFVAGVLSFLLLFKTFYKSLMFGAVIDAMFLVSMFSISSVCIERYIAIVAAPFTYKHIITFKRCVVVCLIFWILTLSLVLVVYAFVYNEWTRMALNILIIIAIIVNCILYFKISKALTKNDINVTKNLGQNVIGRSQKLIRSFILLLVVATIGWVPLTSFLIIATFSESVDNNAFIVHILYCISLSTSFINPFIYWYRLPGMKEGLYEFVCCFRRVDNRQNTAAPTISTSVI